MFIPPPPPPAYVPPVPVTLPEVFIPERIFERVQFPRVEDVGEIGCIQPPPLPISAPPPVTIPWVSLPAPLPIEDIIPFPLPVTIPDIVGAAPQVAVVDTWYSAPVGVAAEIFPESGGGGGRFEEFTMMEY